MLYALCFSTAAAASARRFGLLYPPTVGFRPLKTCSDPLSLRGGDSETLTLDEKVKKAMNKLGLQPPPDVVEAAADNKKATDDNDNCKDGVCTIPNNKKEENEQLQQQQQQQDMDIEALGNKIADDMNVHPSLAMAALGATSVQETTNPNSRKYNEELARNMIQQELDIIQNVSEDSEEVKQLVAEGYDQFLARRALAFSDKDMDDARAILLADKLDEEEEESQAAAAAENQTSKAEMKTVTVDSNFDPASIGMQQQKQQKAAVPPPQDKAPKPAKKEDVVFEATTAQLQELVIESPVPVLLDVYADW